MEHLHRFKHSFKHVWLVGEGPKSASPLLIPITFALTFSTIVMTRKTFFSPDVALTNKEKLINPFEHTGSALFGATTVRDNHLPDGGKLTRPWHTKGVIRTPPVDL